VTEGSATIKRVGKNGGTKIISVEEKKSTIELETE